MKLLGKLLGASSRAEILRALMLQPHPVGVRQVARIAGVHPHSAELVLAELVREGMARRVRASSQPRYLLDRLHPDMEVLHGIFEAVTRGHIRARRRTLNQRARSLLPFVRNATRMLNRARSSRHVT